MPHVLLRDKGQGHRVQFAVSQGDLKERFHIDGTSFHNGNLPLIDVEVNCSPFQDVISWKSFPLFVEEISADVEIKCSYTY